MINLADRSTAQYLYACDTRPAAAGLGAGSFSVYLGILSPAGLARVGLPRGDETMGDRSAYLATLFNGVMGGVGLVGGGDAPALASRLKGAVRDGVPVDTDESIRRVLLSLRLSRESQCLAFMLTVTEAGAIGVGLPPTLRVVQNGAALRRGCFAPARPARIAISCGSAQRVLRLFVASR